MTTLFLIVALTLAGVGVYITKRDPKWGTPILVGVGILTALYILWDHDQSRSQTVVPPAPSVTSSSVPSPGLTQVEPGGQIHDGAPSSSATPSWSPTAVPSPLPGK
ncbi:hypothetical protein [Streptomyces sp. NPDC001450]